MGQTVLVPRDGSGTGMYFGLAASDSFNAAAATSSVVGTLSISMTSLDLIQSYIVVSDRGI
jgi:hypothetical protein